MNTPGPADLPDRDEPRRLVSVIEEQVVPDPEPSGAPDATDDDGAAIDESSAPEDDLAHAVRRADRERAKRRATVERERAKRAAITARAEKTASRVADLKADLRKSRKTIEKSAAKLKREHDARERAEHDRAEWKQRAKTLADELATETARNVGLHDDLQMMRDALAAEETQLESATTEVGELRTALEQALHDSRAAADEATRLREQLLRLHTELGRVLPARYLRRLGLG